MQLPTVEGSFIYISIVGDRDRPVASGVNSVKHAQGLGRRKARGRGAITAKCRTAVIEDHVYVVLTAACPTEQGNGDAEVCDCENEITNICVGKIDRNIHIADRKRGRDSDRVRRGLIIGD